MTTELTTTSPQNGREATADTDAIRCVTYLRVSSRDQAEEGYSIPAQREACRRLIEDRGWVFVDEYCDSGESARTADRPQFQAMLERLSEDRSITCLVVHKLDRLARNLEDHVTVRARLRSLGVKLVSVTESLEESASGKLVEGILASIAEFYSANLAQEIRKGMDQKARQGGWPTRAPLGYRNVRVASRGRRGEAIIVPDEEQAPLVREAFEFYATGAWSITALHREMVTRGLGTPRGHPLSRSKFAEMLKNRAYIGKVVWRDEEYDGVHEPLVTLELFDRVQEVFRLHDRAGERQRRHPHYLRGTLYCGSCGSRLSSTVVKGRFVYFFCIAAHARRTSCREPFTPAEDIEGQVEDLYRTIRLSPGLQRTIEEELSDEIAAREEQRERSVRFCTRRLTSLELERRKLLRAHYADAVPLELFRAEQERIDAEVAYATEGLKRAQAELAVGRKLAANACEFMGELSGAYRRASPKARRRYNQALFDRIDLRGRRIVRVEWQEPFAMELASPHGRTGPATRPPNTAA